MSEKSEKKETQEVDELTVMRAMRTWAEKLDPAGAQRAIEWVASWNAKRVEGGYVNMPLEKNGDPAQAPLFGKNGAS